MRDRLRVLLLNWRDSGHPEGGGAESFCERVASGLAALGHDVTVRCARYPGAPTDETVDGVAYVRRGGRFTVYPRAALAMARRPHGWDVVLDVQNGMPFWAPLFSRALVVNVTHHLHREQWAAVFGRALGRVGWWLESRVAPRVYRRCRYLTVSEATRADLVAVGVDASRVAIVYSGLDAPVLPVDSAAWPRSPQPSVVVLGRLVPHKRVELAMDAVAALPGATLTVVGHGYWEPQLRAYAERLGITDAVTFTGFVDDVTKHRLLAAAWVHALPSVKEGWSLAVVESAAHGTPTVAFRSAGGPTESVRDGETGLLVDDVAGFAAALRRLLTDATLRDGMARAARAHAARFSWPATAAVVEAELRRLTGLPPRATPATVQPDAVVPGPRVPADRSSVDEAAG
jgi:glycosyltransferase involved in cell wall biosynthesis